MVLHFFDSGLGFILFSSVISTKISVFLRAHVYALQNIGLRLC